MKKIRKLIFIIGVLLGIFLILLGYTIWEYSENKKETEMYNPDKYSGSSSPVPAQMSGDSENPSWWDVSDEKSGNPCSELNCSQDTLYVGSKQSKKYYECFCGWAKIIKPSNLVCFKTDEEALAMNYTKSLC